MTFLRYRPDLETVSADEEATFNSIAETFGEMGEKVLRDEGRAMRVSHAKSTGLLTGKITTDAGLPSEYAQGRCVGATMLPRSASIRLERCLRV
jgi:hypothetical protein